VRHFGWRKHPDVDNAPTPRRWSHPLSDADRLLRSSRTLRVDGLAAGQHLDGLLDALGSVSIFFALPIRWRMEYRFALVSF